MRIVVINLDEDTARLERVGSRLGRLGLRWERLPAVHGRRLTPAHESLVDRDAQAARGLRVSPGEIGCWMSHRMAQRMIADGSDEMALVLEDDIRIDARLPEVLERIERGAAGSVDVIRLHRFKRRRKYVPIRDIGGGSTIGLVRPTDSGAQAYVISRVAARTLIDCVPRMVHIADHTLYQHWTHGLAVCSLDPPAVFHDDLGRSSIASCLPSPRETMGPSQFLKRKWHQLERKCNRRLDFYRMLSSGRRGSQAA